MPVTLRSGFGVGIVGGMCLVFGGCATTRVTNLSGSELLIEPLILTYDDSDSGSRSFKTFSVFPNSLLSSAQQTNDILERQMLFFLRNLIEAKGYRFVPLDEAPDFLATIKVSSEFHETYVPPTTATLPVWVPGQTITTYGNYSGTFSANTYGQYAMFGWGSYAGQSRQTTYVPGYVTSQTYTRPGYAVGHWYPSASVSIFDAKTLKHVWLGTGAGMSNSPDVRIASQFVVGSILTKFPNTSPEWLSNAANTGIVDADVWIFTADGNSYVPTILTPGASATKAGLRHDDMILAIDGSEVVNKPYSEIVRLLTGAAGSTVKLVIYRAGSKLTVDAVRVATRPTEKSCAQRSRSQ